MAKRSKQRSLTGTVLAWAFAATAMASLGAIPRAGRCEEPDYGPSPPPNTLIGSTVWSGMTAQFVTCTLEGATGWWWGTDNDGLWHFDPAEQPGRQWQHFRSEDGLYDDSITALCLDRSARLWAGTERRGVAVYNNSGWRNYDILSGPLGAHVNAIAMNPTNGDVWICSEGGVSIYSDTSKNWSYITEADGLPTNDINCLAFTPSGKVFLGAADDGLLIAGPPDGYRIWTRVRADPAASASETGPGLSSDQVNCLLINKAGKIYCGTSDGLSYSVDGGATWSFIHGWKWQVKIKRHVRNSMPINLASSVLPLSDDYISALAYDRNGYLYIGHPQGGLEVLNDSDGSQLYHTRLNEYGTDIRSLTVLTHNALLVGNYGDGTTAIRWSGLDSLPESAPIKTRQPALFPPAAQPPNSDELSALGRKLNSIGAAGSTPAAYFLGEDWQTQGDWVGRYGSEFAVLCAADGDHDYVSGDQTQFSVTPEIGISLNGTSSVSRWLQWERTGDPRVLYDPEISTRREAVWDDQGEQDERLTEGPDVWLTVQVPAGMHRLSLYFMNNEGHTRTTRYRDYLVQLKSSVNGIDFQSTYDVPEILPTVAETRVKNFWPGVYETFAVGGPATYYVKIDRNCSLNTIVQGVFIDPLGSVAPPASPPWMTGFNLAAGNSAVERSPEDKTTASNFKELDMIKHLWSQLDSVYGSPQAAPMQRSDRIELLRAAIAANAPMALLLDWRVKLCIWTGTDWSQYSDAIGKLTVKAP